MTGRERFIEAVGRMHRERLPATARRWADFSPGFRRMLAKQAGVPDKPLDELTELQREKLYQANNKIAALADQARMILIAAVIPKA